MGIRSSFEINYPCVVSFTACLKSRTWKNKKQKQKKQPEKKQMQKSETTANKKNATNNAK